MEPTEPAKDSWPDSQSPPPDEATVEITIKFPPEKHTQKWVFSPADTLEHLILSLSAEFPSYDWSKAKALLEKRRPGLKSVYTPADDSDLPLSNLHDTTLRLLAPQTSALTILQAQREAAAAWQAKRSLARARYARGGPTPSRRTTTADDVTYTFHALRPLPHLPNPGRSLALLERLRDDPGVRAAMRKHRFSVGLLTEMDPTSHTSASHDGVTRILGLNRNKGEVIELRLRTDAYDGYRDYRTIRKTLCHELAHNVHGDHDARFWTLCREIERDVDRADWTRGGRTVGGEDYAPERIPGDEEMEEGMVMDHGGWEGGTYVLGSGEGGSNKDGEEGLSAREIRARAAEARWSNMERATKQGGKGEGEEGGGKKD
ncbi:WLM domain-containing protein [Corynascus novoguineensis]|uniref:WLM domain-containing protein n=1 Tax=Corynascus novoguineensis TaxID=1126955 RepID=A0AAN7HUZ0_9PEZI|nr:WLM domain-containing protein [Corynascus novoguineensis]